MVRVMVHLLCCYWLLLLMMLCLPLHLMELLLYLCLWLWLWGKGWRRRCLRGRLGGVCRSEGPFRCGRLRKHEQGRQSVVVSLDLVRGHRCPSVVLVIHLHAPSAN